MASSVDICNSALIKLGVEPILSLSEDSKQSKLCNRQYDRLRKKLLESHYWNFSMTRVALSQISTSPLFGFAFKYQLPVDCLKAVHLNAKTTKFKVEKDRTLHTTLDGATLLYQIDLTDVSQFSPMFAELLALDLAIDLCMSLTQKRSLRVELKDDRKEALRDARSSDGQEGTNDDLFDDVWLNARTSTGSVGDNTLDE